MFDIVIDNIQYEYVKHISYDDKNYVAYADDKNIYISEYVIDNNRLVLFEITEETKNIVCKEMGL